MAGGYFRPSQQTYFRHAMSRSTDPGLAITVTLYPGLIPGTPTADDAIFIGDGIITRASFNAPMAMVEQEMEIMGSGIPTDFLFGTGVG
jgi:hypothetical protein